MIFWQGRLLSGTVTIFCTLELDSCKYVLSLHSSVSNLSVEGVIEWQHTAKWFLYWPF